nr:CAunnamed protein product [Biomphalaria glabrata]
MASKCQAILILCVVLYCFYLSGALLCYQCLGTEENSQCEMNYTKLINSSTNYTHYKDYFQNCSESKFTWDRCMIETSISNGKITLFHRGCHDGKTFTPTFNDTRFFNLSPNNLTTCAQLSTVVCYSFCDKDFCNGPVPPLIKVCNVSALGYGEECAGHHISASFITSMFAATTVTFICYIWT